MRTYQHGLDFVMGDRKSRCTDRRSRSSVTGGRSMAMEPRSMTAFRDLRDYIERLRRELGEGAVVKIDGAHWDREIGCLSELTAEREGPALLFDNSVPP